MATIQTVSINNLLEACLDLRHGLESVLGLYIADITVPIRERWTTYCGSSALIGRKNVRMSEINRLNSFRNYSRNDSRNNYLIDYIRTRSVVISALSVAQIVAIMEKYIGGTISLRNRRIVVTEDMVDAMKLELMASFITSVEIVPENVDTQPATTTATTITGMQVEERPLTPTATAQDTQLFTTIEEIPQLRPEPVRLEPVPRMTWSFDPILWEHTSPNTDQIEPRT